MLNLIASNFWKNIPRSWPRCRIDEFENLVVLDKIELANYSLRCLGFNHEPQSIYSIFKWNYSVCTGVIEKAHLNCIWDDISRRPHVVRCLSFRFECVTICTFPNIQVCWNWNATKGITTANQHLISQPKMSKYTLVFANFSASRTVYIESGTAHNSFCDFLLIYEHK